MRAHDTPRARLAPPTAKRGYEAQPDVSGSYFGDGLADRRGFALDKGAVAMQTRHEPAERKVLAQTELRE